MRSLLDNLEVACYVNLILWFFKAKDSRSNDQGSSFGAREKVDKRGKKPSYQFPIDYTFAFNGKLGDYAVDCPVNSGKYI